MGIDAEAGRQRTREGQGVAGGGRREVAGDVEREGLAFVGALVCDRGCGRAAVADLASWKVSLIALPWASVAVTVIGLLPKSLSVGTPEMMPVWASMLRPVGNAPEKVRVSPAAGAAKWLETLSEKAWPS